MSALAYDGRTARQEAERRNGLELVKGYVEGTRGYWSTCLGKAVWIAHDFRGAPMKAREDCEPFSYVLAEGGDAALQAKVVAGLAKLERLQAREAKARAPKVKAPPAAKVATVRMQAGCVLGVVGLPRGYTFQVEEVTS